jgi:hypothetical protein
VSTVKHFHCACGLHLHKHESCATFQLFLEA